MAMNNKDRLIEAQHEVRMLSETVIKMHAEIDRMQEVIDYQKRVIDKQRRVINEFGMRSDEGMYG